MPPHSKYCFICGIGGMLTERCQITGGVYYSCKIRNTDTAISMMKSLKQVEEREKILTEDIDDFDLDGIEMVIK